MSSTTAAQTCMNRVLPIVAVCCILSVTAFAAGGKPPVGRTMGQAKEAPPSADPRRPGFAGDDACLSCHKEQGASYEHTAHHLTSQLATRATVPATLLHGPAVLTIVDPSNAAAEPGLIFKIEERKDGFHQTAVTGWGQNLESRSERMDLITGSGVRGETYLYWDGDQLFELPVSYWSEGHQWINSPGYANGSADFSRPVNPGCMECHSSFLRALSADPLTNRYDRASFVPGIACETCHGPGAQHVAAERSAGTAADKLAGMLNPGSFSRDRQVDLCALCHNGIQREEIAPAFSYVPGEPLANYFKPIPSDTVEHPDVHGNQVGLLQRSRRYLSSAKMSCSTCHNVHAPERPAVAYSDRCLTCHTRQSCSVAKKLGPAGARNCIDCHMPVEATSVIVSDTAGKLVRARMRNHWIKIYPDARLP